MWDYTPTHALFLAFIHIRLQKNPTFEDDEESNKHTNTVVWDCAPTHVFFLAFIHIKLQKGSIF